MTTQDIEAYKSRESKVLYRPTKSDILPIVLLFFCTVFTVTICVLTYFLVDAQAQGEALAALSVLSVKGLSNLQYTVNSTRRVVNSVNSLFSINDGKIEEYTQFIPLVYSDNGNFPDFMQRLFYLTYVAPSDFDSFTSAERLLGGIYTNFTIAGRLNSTNTPIPANMNQPFFLPVTHYSHNNTIQLIGFDHYSDTQRTPYINGAILTRTTVASPQIQAASSQNNIVIQYSPVYSRTNSKLLGFVVPIFQLSFLLQTSLSTDLQNNIYASVSDLNSTDPDAAFMYNTFQYQGLNRSSLAFTAKQNSQMINQAMMTVNQTLQFADRTWLITFIPTGDFISQYTNTFEKWIGTIVAVVAWLAVLGFCIFLFFYRRLRASFKAREASEVRIQLLSKFLPVSFLSMIRCKSVRHFRPGSHRFGRIILMTVGIDNYDKMVEEHHEDMMSKMNTFYKKVKTVVRENEGFVHRYEGMTFVCIFNSEVKALNAATSMQEVIGTENSVHVALHSCNVLSGIIGDHESLLAALITDQSDCLKKLSMLCRAGNRKVVMSKDVFDLLRKRIEKSVTYVGRIERTPINGARIYVEAYQLLDTSDQVKLSTRRQFGNVLKKVVATEYIAAKELLDSLVEVDKGDHDIKRMRDNMSRLLLLCAKVSDVWGLTDTLNEYEVLRPAFESFCNMECSIAELSAWRDLREFRQCQLETKRQTLVVEIYTKYCETGPLRLKEGLVQMIIDRMETLSFSTFDDVIGELEFLTTEAHNRFKRSSLFINNMYNLMTTNI
jgi:class 3 adenylate cyclase